MAEVQGDENNPDSQTSEANERQVERSEKPSTRGSKDSTSSEEDSPRNRPVSPRNRSVSPRNRAISPRNRSDSPASRAVADNCTDTGALFSSKKTYSRERKSVFAALEREALRPEDSDDDQSGPKESKQQE